MKQKACVKCGIKKPLSDFYKHNGMKDGCINKCKECCKSEEAAKYKKNKKDATFLEKERKRGREKFHRLYSGKASGSKEAKKKWIERYPEKRQAHIASMHIKVKGKINHHWSYHEEHFLDIIHLSEKDHKKAHRFIVYDQEQLMYRRCDNNELLNTRISHLTFIKWCLENKED